MTAGNIIPSRTSMYCGHFTILLGSIVIFGWVLNKPSFIQIFSHYVPMQFNTAIGFILAGLGLTMATFHPERMAPDTVICFVMTGVALVSITRGQSLVRYIKYSAFSGGIVSALGLVAICSPSELCGPFEVKS